MKQAANPLDQLKDIHLPETVDSFGLAIGWIILIVAAIIIIVYCGYRLRQKIQSRPVDLLTPAKNELQTLSQLTPDNHAIAQLSALLKRLCLIHFPRAETAYLAGHAWVDFLNQQTQDKAFTQEQRKIFCEQAYQANVKLDNATWQNLIETSQEILESIIKTSKGGS